MIDLLIKIIETGSVPSFIIYIIFFLAIYFFAKKVRIIQDVFSLYDSTRNRKIKELDQKIESDIYSEYEKDVFRYKRKVLSYQKSLKTPETHLPSLVHINSYENSKFIVDKLKSCGNLVEFDESLGQFKLKQPIDEVRAEKRSKIGEVVFMINGIAAYFTMFVPIHFFEKEINATNVIPIALFLFFAMILQVFLGGVFMRYMRKQKDAILLTKIKPIDLEYLKKLDNKKASQDTLAIEQQDQDTENSP